jgi:hypothetical protein
MRSITHAINNTKDTAANSGYKTAFDHPKESLLQSLELDAYMLVGVG